MDPATDAVIPPVPARTVYRYGLIGLALTAAAAGLTVAVAVADREGPGLIASVRLLLVAVGVVTAGAALSWRASLPLAWLIAGGTALLAWLGLPPHWDSARLVAFVLAGVGIAGAILMALPLTLRLAAGSAFIVFHFTGILAATTWPNPTPWVTEQIGTRVHIKYLMFMYLRNAYHFYSPEPGPASHIFALVTYDAIDPATGKPETQWVRMPDRAEHTKDPLGLTYYRRLSLTEQVSQTIPEYITPAGFERIDVRVRRDKVARGEFANYPRIPYAPPEVEQPIYQYRMPYPTITRYVLPSYAGHILRTQVSPGASKAKAKTVKLYRLEHRVIDVRMFRDGVSPYHPITYRPYFLGEFRLNDADRAELADPQDPMLYWLVPIVPKTTPGKAEKAEDEIEDFLTRHAGFKVEWRRP